MIHLWDRCIHGPCRGWRIGLAGRIGSDRMRYLGLWFLGSGLRYVVRYGMVWVMIMNVCWMNANGIGLFGSTCTGTVRSE